MKDSIVESSSIQIDAMPPASMMSFEELYLLLSDVSSPLELSYLLNDLPVTYSYSSLIPIRYNLDNNDHSQLALLLGFYSADLAFCIVNGKNELARDYWITLKMISDKLGLNDKNGIEENPFEQNQRLKPSTIAKLLTKNLDVVVDHFRERGQIEECALIAFGGWLESLNILGETGMGNSEYPKEAREILYYEVTMSKKFQQIFLHISDQNFRNEIGDQMTELVKVLDGLDSEFQNVEITNKSTENIEQVTVISQRAFSINDDQIGLLRNKIHEIREALVIGLNL